MADVGSDGRRNDEEDREIGKEDGKEDDVIGERNNGRAVESFDEVRRRKGHSSASWCRKEEVLHEDRVVKEMGEVRRCSTKKIK